MGPAVLIRLFPNTVFVTTCQKKAVIHIKLIGGIEAIKKVPKNFYQYVLTYSCHVHPVK
jgi:hypothetical protein